MPNVKIVLIVAVLTVLLGTVVPIIPFVGDLLHLHRRVCPHFLAPIKQVVET